MSTCHLSTSQTAGWMLAKSFVQMSMAGLSLLHPCSRLSGPSLAARPSCLQSGRTWQRPKVGCELTAHRRHCDCAAYGRLCWGGGAAGVQGEQCTLCKSPAETWVCGLCLLSWHTHCVGRLSVQVQAEPVCRHARAGLPPVFQAAHRFCALCNSQGLC